MIFNISIYNEGRGTGFGFKLMAVLSRIEVPDLGVLSVVVSDEECCIAYGGSAYFNYNIN